jgi:hypothetical protein
VATEDIPMGVVDAGKEDWRLGSLRLVSRVERE